MCQVACPVDINTGDLTRRLREENLAATANLAWSTAAEKWSAITSAGATALTVADQLPAVLPTAVTRLGRALIGNDQVPLYDGALPAGGERRRPQSNSNAQAVFFPSCIGSLFGPGDQTGQGLGATRSFLALCERVGIELTVPEEINSLCCGTPWKSKGITDGYQSMARKVLPALWQASDGGRLPIVCDAASCTEGLAVMAELQEVARAGAPYDQLRFVDAVEFVAENVIAKLDVPRKFGAIALHPTCSSTQLGINDQFEYLTGHIADTIHVPVDWQCCGFAGDRGMLHPELTASATAAEAREIKTGQFDAYVSLNQTCEIAMTRATGRTYQHVLEVVEYATRAQ